MYTISIALYLLFNRGFDLIYGRFLHGVYLASYLNNKVIYETHLPLSDKKDHRTIVFKKLIKSKYFLKMVVISEALKNLLGKWFLNSSKIQVAHDGADNVQNFNSKVNLLGNKKDLKVGYVGHLYKGRY